MKGRTGSEMGANQLEGALSTMPPRASGKDFAALLSLTSRARRHSVASSCRLGQNARRAADRRSKTLNVDKQKQQPPLEKSLERLEAIVEKLESGDVPLEKSIELYEEGRKLGQNCVERLGGLEQRIQKVLENPDGTLSTEPLDPQADDQV